MRKQRGITLIALVITIIVLLILAGVSISMLSGENGILSQVESAKTKTEGSSVEETIKLGLASGFNEEGQYQPELIKQNLESSLNISSEDIIDNEDGTLVVKYDDYEYYVDVDNKSIQKVVPLSSITIENYGDYINYNVDLGIGNVFENELSEKYDWRIFYRDESGNIYIIAEDYVPNTNELLIEAMSKADMTSNASYPYSAYWANGTTFSRTGSASISEEIAKKYMLEWRLNNPTSENANMKVVASLLDTDAWKGFATGVSGAEATGAPTLEMYIKSWNAKQYTQVYCNNSTTTGYYVDVVEPPLTAYVNMAGTTGFSDTLYYPHTAMYNKCAGYWIASPSASREAQILSVNREGYIGNKNYYTSSYGVRPVVCIPAETSGCLSKDGSWTITE